MINEETIVPGGEEPVGSAIKGHHSAKIGVAASGIAAAAVTSSKASVKTSEVDIGRKKQIIGTIRALCASVGASNPGTYLGEWNRQMNGEVL